MFFRIPTVGYTGWVCTTQDGATSSTVDTNCVSRFVSLSDQLGNEADDLTDFRQSDDPETYGQSFENGNWICNPTFEDLSTEFKVQTECSAWLPSEGNDVNNPSIYRFQKGQSYNVQGWSRTVTSTPETTY